MLEIDTQKPQNKPFAINLAVRNSQGVVTKYKTYEADSGAELSDIWEKHSNENQGHKRRKDSREGSAKN